MHQQSSAVRRPVNARRRRGTIVVLAAVLMIVTVGLLAFAVDIGYLCMARSQAQHCADAAALAAALEMTSNENLKKDISARKAAATAKALECAALQDISRTVNAGSSDGTASVIAAVDFGHLENPDNPHEIISFLDPQNPNVVIVRVSCDEARGNAVPVFFAKVFGLDVLPTSATAVAAFSMEKTTGFDKDEGDPPCTLMPFVVHENDWNEFLTSGGPDNWAYNPDTKTVSPGADGIPELKMYPETDLGAPGNFGTVNVGNHNNNSADILKRQIREGPSADDIAHYDGIFRLNPETNTIELTGAATLQLEGDPGMTASIKDALADVVGHPKTIMLYNHLTGQGDNAMFTISRFVGVRVLSFRMTGAARDKYVLIQPAIIQDSSAVSDSDSQTSDFVGQPVHLVR